MKEHRQLLWRAVERYLPQVLQDLLLVLTLLLCIGQQPVDLGAEEDLDLEHGQRGGNKKGIVVTKGKRAFLQKGTGISNLVFRDPGDVCGVRVSSGDGPNIEEHPSADHLQYKIYCTIQCIEYITKHNTNYKNNTSSR